MNNRIPKPMLHTQSGDHPEDDQDCSALEKELNAYIDCELQMEQRHALELRLVTDTEARSRVDELARVQALFRLAYGVILS
jgi:anti-sigma factor RsiW